MDEKELEERFRFLYYGAPLPGEVYRHYKGDLYVVMVTCLRENDGEPTVVYRSLTNGRTWSRPVKEWNEIVVVDEKHVKRFQEQPHRLWGYVH